MVSQFWPGERGFEPILLYANIKNVFKVVPLTIEKSNQIIKELIKLMKLSN